MFGYKKRDCQQNLGRSLQLTKAFNTGEVLGLLGPEPEKYIEFFQKYSLGSEIYLYEINNNRFKKANKSISNKLSNNIHFIKGDLFEEATKFNNISGIDLDFCETLRKDFYIYVGIKLVEILEKNTRQNVWIQITSSIALNASKAQIKARLAEILNLIERQTKYKHFGRKRHLVYCDSRAMLVYQIKLTKGEKKMKKQTTSTKTLKNLSPVAQKMVRDLSQLGYSATDIGTVFDLSNSSVSSIKAHQTMRRNG